METIDRFTKSYEFLSNFHYQNVAYKGHTYDTNEHAFQAAEGTDLKDMDTLYVYQSMADGTWWVRKKEEFDDGRFEYVSRINV